MKTIACRAAILPSPTGFACATLTAPGRHDERTQGLKHPGRRCVAVIPGTCPGEELAFAAAHIGSELPQSALDKSVQERQFSCRPNSATTRAAVEGAQLGSRWGAVAARTCGHLQHHPAADALVETISMTIGPIDSPTVRAL